MQTYYLLLSKMRAFFMACHKKFHSEYCDLFASPGGSGQGDLIHDVHILLK